MPTLAYTQFRVNNEQYRPIGNESMWNRMMGSVRLPSGVGGRVAYAEWRIDQQDREIENLRDEVTDLRQQAERSQPKPIEKNPNTPNPIPAANSRIEIPRRVRQKLRGGRHHG